MVAKTVNASVRLTKDEDNVGAVFSLSAQSVDSSVAVPKVMLHGNSTYSLALRRSRASWTRFLTRS